MYGCIYWISPSVQPGPVVEPKYVEPYLGSGTEP